MAQTDSSASSRKTARNKYSPLSNTFLATGTTYGPGSPPSSGVVPYPGTGMNPFLLTLPPHAHVSTYNRNLSQTGTGSGSGSEYTSSDSTQPPTPTASSFPRTMVSAQSGIQLQPWYPWLHSQPQLQAYPTQPQVSSLPQLQSTSSISGSQPSSVPSPASTSEQRSTATPVQSGPVTDFSSLLELLLIPLKAFQTQFTAFEAHFSTVQTDMKDVLTELRTIRNAQKQMGKRMGVLEDVIGVSTGKSARARGRGRGRGRGKGRARGGNMSVEEVQIELEPDMEGAEIGFEPENSPTFLHRFAAIESAIEELLSRESGLCKAHPPVIHPLPLPRHPPVTSDTAPEIPLPQLATAPLLQQPKLNPPVTLPAYYQQSTASSVPSPILALPPESGTLPLCTVTKQYTDASVFACPSPPPPQAPCALPFPSHSHGPGLTPADWNGNSARLSTYTSEYLPHFSRLHASQSTSAMAMSDPNSPTRCPGSTVGSLRRLMLPFAHSPIRTSYTMSAPNLCQRSEIILDAEAGNQALQEAGVSMSAPASASQERVTTPPIRDTSHAQHATLWPSTRVARSISIPPLDLIPGHAPDSEGSLALQPARPLPSFVHIQLADNKIEVSSEQPLPSPPTSSPYTPRSESDRARSASASCDLANEELEGLAERDGRESQAGSGPEDIQMAIEAEVGSIPEVSVTNERTMSPEPVPPEIEDRGVSHPAGEGKASSRPSIPLLESSADIRSPCEPRTESAPLPNISNEAELATEEVLISPTPLRPESPMMATPPSLTPPPPSLEQEQVAHQSLIQQHSLKYRPKRGLFPRIRSLLTPPPPSPSPFEVREIGKEDGSAPVGRAGGDADTVMEVAVSAPDDAGPAVHDAGGAEGADTLKRNGGTSLGRDRAVVVQKVGPSSSAGLENAILVPAITITYSPEPVNASSSHSPANEHDLAHPSPPQHPVASAVSSRDHTPSDSHQTHDEDEVWRALMPGTPETTTSILDSISRSPSVHPSTSENEYRVELPLYQPLSSSTSALLAINPSMLHDRTSLPLGPKFPGAPYIPERLLSPLTSLDEDGNTKVDSNSRPLGDGAHISAHHSRGRGEQRGPTPSGFSIGRRRGASANGNRGHRSEPYHPPSTSHTLSHFNPNAPHLTNSMPHVRAASEASSSASVRSRSLGGPGASSNELAILARREPLRIHLKVPVSMRGQKRKWGVVDSEVVQEEASTGGGSGTGADAGRESAVIGTGEDDEMRDRQEEESGGSVSAAVSADPLSSLTIGSESTLQGSPTPTNSVIKSNPTFVQMNSSARLPSKRSRKNTEDDTDVKTAEPQEPKQPRGCSKKVKRVLRPKSPRKYFVLNGEVVMVEPESPPSASITQPSSQIRESKHGPKTTRKRARKAPINHTMKTPPSFPAKPSGFNARTMTASKTTASPTKQSMQKMLSPDDGEWPELTGVFDKWDRQFIQCDNCDMWYHYGCVGIEPEDPRVEPEAVFICPVCHIQTAKRQTLRKRDDTCARSDCPEPIEANTDIYFVERLVGRKKIGNAGFLWLAKWDGYPMTQSSWIPEGNVVGDGTKLFETFRADAMKEGIDLSQDVALLQEAVATGWGNQVDEET